MDVRDALKLLGLRAKRCDEMCGGRGSQLDDGVVDSKSSAKERPVLLKGSLVAYRVKDNLV